MLHCDLHHLQAWSITYVSWLTFVFLLWSCILWMVRDRRRYAMITSPFMVMYGNLLLVLQYIWSFEVLNKVSGFFLKGNVPFSELWTKVWTADSVNQTIYRPHPPPIPAPPPA